MAVAVLQGNCILWNSFALAQWLLSLCGGYLTVNVKKIKGYTLGWWLRKERKISYSIKELTVWKVNFKNIFRFLKKNW